MELHNKQLEGKRWIIGVSGGADSMALLDMCRKAKIDVIAAHMNYRKRDTADRDMQCVVEYCKHYGICCRVEILTKHTEDNFQAFAREERYRFYRELMNEYHADGVLVAHHLDDHLETYIMQKLRNSMPEYYGIKEDTMLQGCHVKRMLLSYTKQELREYCMKHQVPFFDDESNFTRAYTRNKIRFDYIDQMDRNKKQELAEQITQENRKLSKRRTSMLQFYETWKKDCASLLDLTRHQQILLMDYFICQGCGSHVSKKEIITILHHLRSNNWTRRLANGYDIVNSYGTLTINRHQDVSYSYVYHQIVYEKTPYFTIAKQGASTEALSLFDHDFPIEIRNVHKGDYIQLRFGKKKIHRWFIDRKIPQEERKCWPVVVNAQGNIILVPKIGCDIEHFSNNPGVFVIK